MTRTTIDSALVEKLLAVPGVTEAALRKAIYRLRVNLGLCTKGNGGCNEPSLPGKPLCAKHNRLQEAASDRFNRKQAKAST